MPAHLAMAIVTLTTDFGTSDGYVGAMKGILLSLAPDVRIVDITHQVPRQDLLAAAHALATAVPFFPAGTIHLAVVDPGVGTARKPVVVREGEMLFVGPDNGICSLVMPRPEGAFEIAEPGFRRDNVSATFHGRDVFAVAAGRLAAGARPEDAGPPVVLRGKLPPVAGAEDATVHRVQHIDAFGNLITNIAAQPSLGESRFRVAGRDISGLAETYESVEVGELLAYIGSRGTVEIAVREGNAAELLGAARGTAIEVLPRSDTRP